MDQQMINVNRRAFNFPNYFVEFEFNNLKIITLMEDIYLPNLMVMLKELLIFLNFNLNNFLLPEKFKCMFIKYVLRVYSN